MRPKKRDFFVALATYRAQKTSILLCAHAIEDTAAAEQSEGKKHAVARSARDDKKRAQKSGVSQRRRLAARKQKRRSRRYRRFINPSLRLVESFGSASAVAATPKRDFGTFSRSTGRTHFYSTASIVIVLIRAFMTLLIAKQER